MPRAQSRLCLWSSLLKFRTFIYCIPSKFFVYKLYLPLISVTKGQ